MLLKPRLLTPGPTPLLPEGLAAQSLATVHHRTPEFRALFRSARAGLRRFYRLDEGEEVVILSCSGTGGLEAALANACAPGDTVLVASAGKFGERWLKLAKAYGLTIVEVKAPYGATFDLDAFRAAVKAAPRLKAFCVQEHESSTGVRHPVKEMAAILRETQPEALVLVDAITGVGVHDVKLSDGFDVLVCGSQKALAIQPGLAFLGLSKRYLAQLDASHLPRFYFDLRNELKAHEGDGTAWTPAIGLIAALDAACRWLEGQGGVEALIANAALQAKAFRAALDAWGLPNFAKAPGHALTAVSVEGSSRILKSLRDKAGLSLANGQGEMEDHMVRVAHLGYVDGLDTLMVIQALEMALSSHGVKFAAHGGEAAQAVLAGTLR
ncbi:MAG TPA: alanine--glyoxylate aminotransferase family protein [Holophagaceae bacterium]|nr:alanine--glyoxylate aminotransferase family protein [Holophagaceae bacterium]